MKKVILGIILMLSIILPAVEARGINAGDGLYEFNLCNCIQEGADYFPENKTFRFVASPSLPQDSNVSYGLGLFQAKFDPSRSPDASQIKSFTINGGQLVDMVKNKTLMAGEFQKSPADSVVACVFIEVYFYLFLDHTVLNEGPIRHYMTNGTEYHPASIFETNPVIIQVDGEDNPTFVVGTSLVLLGVAIVLVAIWLIVYKKFNIPKMVWEFPA